MTLPSPWVAQTVTFLTALALVSAFGMLALRTGYLVLRVYGVQSVCLGLAALLTALDPLRWHVAGVAGLAIVMKGFVIPWFLLKIVKNVHIKRESEPFIPYPMAMVGGIGLALVAYAVVEPMAAGDPFAARGFALALALMQLGLWLMVSRKKALTQIIGLLMVENGLFMAALSTSFGMPMIVELGLMFDLLVAVVVMGLLVFRIHDTTASISTERLSRLKG